MSRHTYPCHVRFSDVDIYRHVNNVKYFEYYQEARLAFMTSLGRETVEPGLSLVVARIAVDYKRPILWRGEPYAVETWVTEVGGSSFGLAAQIKDDGQVLSSAEVTMVTFDLDTQKSRPLTDRERARLLTAVE
jgi:acyl-CoA thioester hydrolase